MDHPDKRMMSSCVLHVGMPKTGTSSIQDYLYAFLRDPRFSYVGFGEINGSRALSTISLGEPERYWIHQLNRIGPRKAAKLKADYVRHLRRCLSRAKRKGQTAILSGEGCWHLQPEDLQRLKELITDNGFEARVIAYLRPYHSWLESSFQQNVKWGLLHHDPFRLHAIQGEYRQVNYMQKLEHLADVFGEASLTVRPFRRRGLVQGCAVRDFCAQVGIDDQGTTVPRSNDGISLDAIRFFYAYAKFGRELDPPTVRQTNALICCLQELPGDKLRFHSSILAPVADRVEQQRIRIRDRFGLDLGSEEPADEAAANVVQSEQDLYQFTPQSLAWLATRSGCAPIQGQGVPAARLVAASMDRLRRRVVWTHGPGMVRDRLRLELNRWWKRE